MAAFAGLEAQRHRWIERLLNRRTSARKTLCVASLTSEGDFALGVIPQKFAPEQSGVGLGSHGGQIDSTAGDIRVFVEDYPEQTNGGRLSHCRRHRIATHRLGPA